MTWEAAATRPVPALPRPVPWPAPTDPSSSRASRPERRAARGPSTGSGAPALPVQHEEIVTESNRPSSENCSARSREAVSVHTESLVCVVAAETCLRRRNARLPGIICRRLQITVVMRASLGLLGIRQRRAERGDLCSHAHGRHGCPMPVVPKRGRLASGRLTKRGGTGHQPWAHWPARLGYWRPPGRRRLPAVPRAVDLPGGDVPVGRG